MPVLFEHLCRDLLEFRRLNYRHKSYLAAKNQFRHLMNTFRGKKVSSLNHDSWITHAIRARTEDPTRNLNDDHKYFRILMNAAYARKIIKTPIGKIPKPDVDDDVGRELSNEELRRIWMAARDDAEMRLLIETAVRMGWRKNTEMLACRWEWVDWTSKSVRLPARRVKTKKTRIVPIPADILKRLKKLYKARRGPLVFPSPNNPNKPLFIEKRWRKIKKEAGIECRWHDFRHTAASRMVRANVPLKAISRVLGMGIGVLNRIYAHVHIDDLRLAVKAVRFPKR